MLPTAVEIAASIAQLGCRVDRVVPHGRTATGAPRLELVVLLPPGLPVERVRGPLNSQLPTLGMWRRRFDADQQAAAAAGRR